jgi:hypothetical protein
MPKLKSNRSTMNAALVQLIWGRKAALGYTEDKLAQMAGCSVSKLYCIKKCPADHLSDVLLLCWRMDIPLEDFKSAILYP